MEEKGQKERKRRGEERERAGFGWRERGEEEVKKSTSKLQR